MHKSPRYNPVSPLNRCLHRHGSGGSTCFPGCKGQSMAFMEHYEILTSTHKIRQPCHNHVSFCQLRRGVQGLQLLTILAAGWLTAIVMAKHAKTWQCPSVSWPSVCRGLGKTTVRPSCWCTIGPNAPSLQWDLHQQHQK